MKLLVPHFKQSHAYTCLPACARMVLAYLGYTYAEQELTAAFNVFPLLTS